jgi:hypothetical protein
VRRKIEAAESGRQPGGERVDRIDLDAQKLLTNHITR